MVKYSDEGLKLAGSGEAGGRGGGGVVAGGKQPVIAFFGPKPNKTKKIFK